MGLSAGPGVEVLVVLHCLCLLFCRWLSSVLLPHVGFKLFPPEGRDPVEMFPPLIRDPAELVTVDEWELPERDSGRGRGSERD